MRLLSVKDVVIYQVHITYLFLFLFEIQSSSQVEVAFWDFDFYLS